MSRTVLVVAGVLVLAGALVAWLLGAGSLLPGAGRGPAGPGDRDGRPAPAAVPEALPEASAPGGAAAHGPGLAAPLRPERRGLGSIAARVVDAREAPIEGAKVLVQGTGWGGEAVRQEGLTAADGTVVLKGVPAGVGFVARVEAPGKAPLDRPDVEVRAARTTDLGSLMVGVRGVVSGRVVDHRGAPVVGAAVRATTALDGLQDLLGNFLDTMTTMGREPTALSEAVSGSDGAFTLREVPAGLVAVRARAPGRRPALARVRVGPDGASQSVVLHLLAGARVAGVVVTHAGAPVAGAGLAILSQDEANQNPLAFFEQRLFTTTDAAGRFEAVVAEGAKNLRAVVDAAGYPSTWSKSFEAGATDLRIVVGGGGLLEVTVLSQASGDPLVGAQVVVAVGDAMDLFDSAEAAGAIAMGAAGENGVASIVVPPGKIQMLMVTFPGHAALMRQPGAGAPREEGAAAAGDALPGEVAAGGTTRATVRLAPGVRVRGRVTEKLGGAPVAGAEVRPMAFFAPSTAKPATTDADGNYLLEGVSGIAGQEMAILRVTARGFVKETANVRISADALKDGEVVEDVRLARAAVLRGRVVDDAGRGVAGAKVSTAGAMSFDFEDLLGGGSGVVTDGDGNYLIPDAVPSPAGSEAGAEPDGGDGTPERVARLFASRRLRVTATLEGFVAGRSGPITARAGEEVAVPPIRLSRGAVARGVVRSPDGATVPGAAVAWELEEKDAEPDFAGMIVRMAQGGGQTVRADAEGRFEIPTLAPGTLRLTARADGFAASRRTADVGADAVVADVLLRRAGDLTGIVIGGDGRPLAGAHVSNEDALEGVQGDAGWVEQATVETDAQGRFVLKGLPQGSVVLSVRAKGHEPARETGVPGSRPVEVRLAGRAAARPPEIVQRELLELTERLMKAGDQQERLELSRRIQQLQEELRNAQDRGPVEDVPPAPEDEDSR